MKQIEVKFDAKAKDVLANTLDLGGGEPITIKGDVYDITIDGIKLLNLLKSLNVDVDAELDYSITPTYAGVVLGLTYNDSSDAIDNGSDISLGRVGDYDTDTNYALLKVADFTDEDKIQLTTSPVTFTSMLTDLGSNAVFQDISIYTDLTILPMLAVRTGSSYSSTVYQLSNDDFNAIVKFEPKEFESEE